MSIEQFYTQFFRPGIISTDSRSIRPGDIFVALKGENFDGAEFANKAVAQGAKLAVVERGACKGLNSVIEVDDTLTFLHDLAKYHRQQNSLNIIGLTGTNGKTTTKELIGSILSRKYKVQSTVGNLNNHIGVPMTVLSIVPETEISIVEMGANHPGEIALLCQIAAPQFGLITNIGKAHLEGFGGFEGVKRSKAELYQFLKTRKGTIFYNNTDSILSQLVGDYEHKIAYKASGGICTGKIVDELPFLTIEITDHDKNSETVHSNLYGNYNLDNVLAAVAIGIYHGIPLNEIKEGIESYHPDSLRSQVITFGSVELVLDCYNANPTSMEQALFNFAAIKSQKKAVILGGMKELGPYENEEHNKLGKLIDNLDFDDIILLGNEFQPVKIKNAKKFQSYPELADFIHTQNFENTTILVKGSRAYKLERIADLIRKDYSYTD